MPGGKFMTYSPKRMFKFGLMDWFKEGPGKESAPSFRAKFTMVSWLIHLNFCINIIQFKIFQCDPQTQFTCYSGHCIGIEQRCDNQQDCQDGSDEFKDTCKVAEFNADTYIKSIAPSTRNGSPLELHVSLELLRVEEVDVQRQGFVATFRHIMRKLHQTNYLFF